MKLFDIETGKYLELGKDWLYGGDIITFKQHLELPKTEPTGTLKTLCDLTGAVVYGDRYVLLRTIGTLTDGDITREMQYTGFCMKANTGEKVANTNDYYLYEGRLFYKKDNNIAYIQKSEFEDVLKKIRNDIDYAKNFFYQSFEYKSKKEQKTLTPKIKEMMVNESAQNLEIYYFQTKMASGLYIIGTAFENPELLNNL